jgi:general secretion pathway protein F
MGQFAFAGRTQDGKMARGVIQAGSLQEARDALMNRLIIPLDIKPAKNQLFQSRDALGDREAGEIARDLSRFLKAGLPLVASLRALASSGFSRKTRDMLEGAASDMEAGKPLSEVLSGHSGRVVQALAGVIKVGEKTGRLGEALENAASSFALAAGFREQVSSALAYPALVLTMVLGALTVFVAYVLPNLRPLFEGPGLTPPQGIATLFQIADVLGLIAPFGLATIILFVLLGIFVPAIRQRIGALVEKVSFTKVGLGLAGLIVYAGVARRLALGLSAGVSAPDALSNAVSASSYSSVRDAGLMAIKSMAAGVALSQALNSLPGVPGSLVNLARAGETAGRIAPAIKEAADLLEQSARTRADRMVALLAPAVTIATGGIVGLVVVTIFSGLASIADGILQ